MKKINVAIIDKNINKIDSLRGIGVHTNELINNLKLIDGINLEIKSKVGGNFDIYHFPKFNPYFINLPLFKKGKIVLTIHDLIPLIYKDEYPSGLKGSVKYLINKILIKNVDAVITISVTSKKDIVRIFKINPDKVFVTYLAANESYKRISDTKRLEEVSKKYNLPQKFILYVGDVNYNKNLYSLIKACKKINQPLVIVGKKAKESNLSENNVENKPFIKILKEFGSDKSIIRLGYVSDQDKICIYNLATVYCQPSFYEGFSLPILEALLCGVAVVASKIQTHTEIFKDSILYADPKNYLDISEKINNLINDNNLRNELIEKGFKRAKTFSWKQTADQTYSVYKSLLK